MAPNCAEAELYYSIEGIVQDWANGMANHGVQLRAANESDATNWRMYRSSEAGDPAVIPKLIVDYTPPTNPDGTIPESAATGVAAIDGVPVPGADVLAMAWPKKELLDGLPDGADVPTHTIGVAKADSRGRFVLAVDPDALPADYVADDGSVDVELAIADATREARWHYTATRPAPATAAETTIVTPLWSTLPADAAGTSGPATLAIDPGAQARIAETRADTPAAWVDPGPEGDEIDPVTEIQPDPDPETVPEWQDTTLGAAAGDQAAGVAVERRESQDRPEVRRRSPGRHPRAERHLQYRHRSGSPEGQRAVRFQHLIVDQLDGHQEVLVVRQHALRLGRCQLPHRRSAQILTLAKEHQMRALLRVLVRVAIVWVAIVWVAIAAMVAALPVAVTSACTVENTTENTAESARLSIGQDRETGEPVIIVATLPDTVADQSYSFGSWVMCLDRPGSATLEKAELLGKQGGIVLHAFSTRPQSREHPMLGNAEAALTELGFPALGSPITSV
ncbi:hypothetical protein [Nonomuraea rubra]|uniref:Uncharacterized protein n=1 Tax=Nonomuraea rubra TaxID=46180 RepID=A0A7X0U1C1_9ACTN|nr:hypothetical protein [Nonomuraea rubra]MBB6551220.1 hypothetical protein [Nonomuraea rubra]